MESQTLNKDRSIISEMFNKIAPRYDFLNHLLSFGIDKIWRKRLIKYITQNGAKNALDIACGTGDLTIALYKKGIEVVGLDIADKMLQIAENKSAKIATKRGDDTTATPIYICGSAESIPFKNEQFDAVTISFGIRNFNHREECLKEIHRVIKKGGNLAILEFATPKNRLWRAIYNLYFLNILPLIGKIVSKDRSAYSYLPESVTQFPQYDNFNQELSKANFIDIKYRSCSGGIALLYTATKG